MTRRASLGAAAAVGLGVVGVQGAATTANARDCLVLDRRGRYTLDEALTCLEITAEHVRVDAQGNTVDRVFVRADRATVRNVGGQGGGREGGFFLESADRCRIIDNRLGLAGIQLTDAAGNTLRNLSNRGPDSVGLRLTDSDRNRVIRCSFKVEETITLRNSDRNVLMGNETETEDVNARLRGSDRNVLLDNRLEGEGNPPGVGLTRCDRNALIRNVTIENGVGIELVDSDSNRLIRNRSCNEEKPVRVDDDSTDNLLRANVVDCSGA